MSWRQSAVLKDQYIRAYCNLVPVNAEDFSENKQYSVQLKWSTLTSEQYFMSLIFVNCQVCLFDKNLCVKMILDGKVLQWGATKIFTVNEMTRSRMQLKLGIS